MKLEHRMGASVPIAIPEATRKVTLPNGEEIDIHNLEPVLNNAISLVYEDARVGSEQAEAFERLVTEALDSGRVNDSIVDKYFECFTPLWRYHLNTGLLAAASDLWEKVMRPVTQWEGVHRVHRHKGTAFYFSGWTSIVMGNFERGYLLLHRALDEDITATKVRSPGTPAYAAVVIDHRAEQAFKDWVLIKQQIIEGAMEQYCRKHNRQLTFDSFKDRFLAKESLREEVFSFSYCVARFWHLNQLSKEILDSEFGANTCLNLLFDLAVVIDKVIPRTTSGSGDFSRKATHLSQRAKPPLGLTQNQLQQIINQRFRLQFGRTTQQFLNQTFSRSGCHPTGLSAALALTYGCRNRGAHHVASDRIVGRRFQELFQLLMETLFLAVETFRRKGRK